MSNSPTKSYRLPYIITWVVAAVVAFYSLCLDLAIVVDGGSIDYRNRVTGARLLRDGYDAYHYKWKTGNPEIYCDVFNHLSLKVSKTTVSPTMLALMIPVSNLDYRGSQMWWLLIQWVMMLGTLIIWWMIIPHGIRRILWVAFCLGTTFTLTWRLHIDRGQVYIVLAFLVSLWIYLSRLDSKVAQRFAGIIAAFLVALRPPFLLLFAPFIWLKKKEQMIPAVIGGLLFLLLPMMFRGAAWNDYLTGMHDWSETYRTYQGRPNPVAQAYPPTIENIPINTIATFKVRQFADSSLYRILKWWGLPTPFPTAPLSAAFVVILGAWFWFCRKKDITTLLTGIAAWTFLLDWFLPAYRNPYNDLLILGSAAFLLCQRFKWFLVTMVSIPVGYHVYRELPPSRAYIYFQTIVFLVPAFAGLIPLKTSKAGKIEDS